MPARHFDRDRLCKLLALLGSSHDGEALAAARHAAALLHQAGLTWDEVISRAESQPAPKRGGEEDRLLRELLASNNVSDVLKIRLADMQTSLKRGRLAQADRRLLHILHRKAVLDGAIVTA